MSPVISQGESNKIRKPRSRYPRWLCSLPDAPALRESRASKRSPPPHRRHPRTSVPETSDAIDASASEPSQAPGGVSERGQQLAGYLYEAALSPWLLILGLGLSALLGRLHALTPGRRRTFIAAYLIGSRGTAKHAATLGGIVTVTHTASIIAVGLLALLAEARATVQPRVRQPSFVRVPESSPWAALIGQNRGRRD